MKDRIIAFIKYNNTVAIAFFFLFSGLSVAYAANPKLQASVYARDEVIVSVDNTLLLSTDLDSFDFNLKIDAVTEDAINYYAAYSYTTLAVQDGVWRTTSISDVLTVNKEALGSKDLGLYVAKELADNANYELSYLRTVQKLERAKGESKKQVATAYSGLVGKFLNPTENTVEGYEPVVREEGVDTAADVELLPDPEAPPESAEPKELEEEPTEELEEETVEPELPVFESSEESEETTATSTPPVLEESPEDAPTEPTEPEEEVLPPAPAEEVSEDADPASSSDTPEEPISAPEPDTTSATIEAPEPAP